MQKLSFFKYCYFSRVSFQDIFEHSFYQIYSLTETYLFIVLNSVPLGNKWRYLTIFGYTFTPIFDDNFENIRHQVSTMGMGLIS